MTVFLNQSGQIALSGNATLEDAEPLLRLLIDNPGSMIAWRDCTSAHSAVVQVLLAARRPAVDEAGSKNLGLWVVPSLQPLVGGQRPGGHL